ncbi:MAG TPA: hypothetical protein VLB07_00655 [Woeseiaceae bacterium]|nr:hypothetical protein [Woeseiaceae bacterium]
MRKLTVLILIATMGTNAAAHSLADGSPALLQLAHQIGSPHHLPALLVIVGVTVAGIVAAAQSKRRDREDQRGKDS